MIANQEKINSCRFLFHHFMIKNGKESSGETKNDVNLDCTARIPDCNATADKSVENIFEF
jgi:hypothetical protein